MRFFLKTNVWILPVGCIYTSKQTEALQIQNQSMEKFACIIKLAGTLERTAKVWHFWELEKSKQWESSAGSLTGYRNALLWKSVLYQKVCGHILPAKAKMEIHFLFHHATRSNQE